MRRSARRASSSASGPGRWSRRTRSGRYRTGRWGSHLPASDADTAGRYHQYISEYAEARGRPTDRLYLDVHEGHYSYLKEGEEQFVDPDRVRHGYIGSGPEIIEKVEAAEAHGINHIALAAHSPAGARELIADFAREVIQPTSG